LKKVLEIVHSWLLPKESSSQEKEMLNPLQLPPMHPEKLHLMWEFLANPSLLQPPKELQEVTDLEWYLAGYLLQRLQQEREQSRLH
jgi:hypothetical protein